MIRILCVDISDADQELYDRLYAQASPERRHRAERYLRREDKLRCVTADALLRRVVGTAEYQVERHEGGKPYIKDRADLHYNISHSGSWVVIAWGDSPVGVDVQKHDTSVDLEGIVQRYFTPDERAYVLEKAQQKVQRFYEIWTKKESCLKYTGRGLRTDLGSFSVLDPEWSVRCQYRPLDGGYSLCLCTTERESRFYQLPVGQLL